MLLVLDGLLALPPTVLDVAFDFEVTFSLMARFPLGFGLDLTVVTMDFFDGFPLPFALLPPVAVLVLGFCLGVLVLLDCTSCFLNLVLVGSLVPLVVVSRHTKTSSATSVGVSLSMWIDWTAVEGRSAMADLENENPGC